MGAPSPTSALARAPCCPPLSAAGRCVRWCVRVVARRWPRLQEPAGFGGGYIECNRAFWTTAAATDRLLWAITRYRAPPGARFPALTKAVARATKRRSQRTRVCPWSPGPVRLVDRVLPLGLARRKVEIVNVAVGRLARLPVLGKGRCERLARQVHKLGIRQGIHTQPLRILLHLYKRGAAAEASVPEMGRMEGRRGGPATWAARALLHRINACAGPGTYLGRLAGSRR